MSQRNVICLVVDGLRAAALGAYGNTSCATPHLDWLASRSRAVDWFWADSPRLESFYRSALCGVHAMRPAEAVPSSVVDELQPSGVRSRLVTDERALVGLAGSLPWEDAQLLEFSEEVSANQIGETAMGHFFAGAAQRLIEWKASDSGSDADRLFWIHSRGMHGPWDAPRALREELLADEDPAAPDFVVPPSNLQGVDDPDELLGYRVAYAAQVRVLDACLGALMATIQDNFAKSETLVLLIGSRGFALGEHGAIGTDDCQLYGEQLHLPCLLYKVGDEIPSPRIDRLSQPSDVCATLFEWFGVDASGRLQDGRSLLPSVPSVPRVEQGFGVAANDSEQVIRTTEWMLLRLAEGERLYSKPDDRWEFNDVASRCPQVVESLGRELAKFVQCCQLGEPLPAVLSSSERE